MDKKRSTMISYLLIIASLLSLSSCKEGIKSASNKQQNVNLELESAEIFITAQSAFIQLAPSATINFEVLKQPFENFPTIILDQNKTFQTIVGFGGAITDAAAETFYKLPKEKQNEFLTSYFSLENGIGYSLCRTHINSCDFSSESYAYSNVPGDLNLENFTISHDKQFRIPLIKEALSISNGDLQLFASPWSPPAWMKDNNDMLHGGKVKPEYYQSWADYFVRFLSEYQKEGINFWGLTVQNEPMAVQTWESCIYTAEEERDFVKRYLGPTLGKSEFANTKLIVWDHNRGIMYQRAKVVYDDPEAAKYVWGTGFHWYVGDHFENVKLHSEAFPDKNMLFTEGCVYPFNLDSINEWHWGETYGKSIINDLNNGAAGWVDWNILVDERGGPNHVNNYCFAPVIGNTKTGELLYMNSYYYLGHFSKFIRPGAKRIICSSNDDNLWATSFINPDGKIATVVQNPTNEDKEFGIWIEGKFARTKSPAHSIMTVVIN